MRQRDISKYRIMRSFNDDELTGQEVIDISGVKRAAAYPYLSELVKENRLTFRVDKDGKTKVYRRVNPCDPQPLLIRGSRRKKQVQRLQRLGLKNVQDYLWVDHRGPGRPSRPPKLSVPTAEDSARLMKDMRDLGTAIRYVAKKMEEDDDWYSDKNVDKETGRKPHWLTTGKTKFGDDFFMYSIRGSQRKQIEKTIPKARDHLKMLKKQKRAGLDHPPRTIQEDEMRRSG